MYLNYFIYYQSTVHLDSRQIKTNAHTHTLVCSHTHDGGTDVNGEA